MAKRTRSHVQAAEMGFLRRGAELSVRDRVRSSAIREELDEVREGSLVFPVQAAAPVTPDNR